MSKAGTFETGIELFAEVWDEKKAFIGSLMVSKADKICCATFWFQLNIKCEEKVWWERLKVSPAVGNMRMTEFKRMFPKNCVNFEELVSSKLNANKFMKSVDQQSHVIQVEYKWHSVSLRTCQLSQSDEIYIRFVLNVLTILYCHLISLR